MEFIFTSIAKMYGYITLANLLKNNFGLIVILLAFLGLCLVLYRLLDRQFPKPGQDSVKRRLMVWLTVFLCSCFFCILLFTVFYEKKRLDDESFNPSVNKVVYG